MGARIDISDELDALYEEVTQRCAEVGEQTVQRAREEGDYHDVTGNLRSANYYSADKTGLELGNSAEYATHVEGRGHKVLTDFILDAESELRK